MKSASPCPVAKVVSNRVAYVYTHNKFIYICIGFENVEQRLIGRMVNAGLNLLAVGGWKFWKVVCRKMVQALMSSAVTKVADLSLNPPSPPSSSMSRVHNNRPRWTWLDGLSPVTSAIDGIVAQLLTPHINSLTQNIDKMATSIAGPNHARYVANAATFFTGSPNQAISLKVNTRGLRYSYGTMHDASKLIIDDAIEDANDEIKSALFYQNICVYTIVSTLCNLCKLPNFIARTFPSLPGVIGMREKLQTNGDGNNEDGRNDYMGAPGDVGTIERGRLNNPPSSSSPSPVSPLSASSTEQDMASAIVTSLSLRTQNLLSSVYNALSRSSEYEVDTGGDGGDSDEDGEEEKEENYGENGDTNQKYYSLSSAFDVEVSLSEQRGSLEKHSEHVNGDMREYRQTDLQEGEYSLRVETLMSQSYATPPVQVLQRRLCDPLHPVLAAQSFSLPSTFSVNRVGSFQTGTLKLSLPEEMQYQSTPLSFLKRFYFRFVVEKTSFLGRVRVERMAGLVSVLDLYRQAKGNMRRMVKAGLQEMPGSTSVSLPIPFFKSEGFHGDFRNTAVLLVHSQLVRKLAASSKLSINHRAPVSGPDYQSLQQDGEGLLGRPLFANQRVYLTGTRITNLDGELKVALIQNPVLDPSKRPGVDRTHQFLFQLSNLQLDISTRAHVILSKVQPLVPNTGLIRMQCRVDEVQVLMEPALLPHSKGGMLYFNSKVVSKGEAHLKVVQGLQLIRSLFDLEAYVMEYLHKYYLSDKFFRQFFTMDSSDPESPAVNTAAILGKALMEEDARLKEGKEERGEEEDGINIELELGFDHIALGEDERQQIPQAISDLNKLLVGMGYMVRDKTYEDSN